MGPFHWVDNVIYDELRNVTPVAAVEKGDCAVLQDCAGFWVTDLAALAAGTFIYRCRQVIAAKVTGTGEEILPGDRLYYIVAQDAVSPTPSGVAGTDSYFVGWAKEYAGEDDPEVLMNFDGTRYDQLV
jgi:hypothetical protein